jgi:hypothetical protein
MKKHLLKFIAIASLLAPSKAFAQVTVQTDFGTARNIGEFMGIFFDWAIPITGGVAVIMLIWAGYLYMTSQGNQENITSAKDIITGVVLGLLLLFGAEMLLKSVIGTIL